MTKLDIMNLGAERAKRTMCECAGGPFGAVITRGNEIIAIASNTVIQDNDPTAHAEMNAIRKACKELGTYDLSGCVLYATGYPCPMCLSAIIWSNIKEVYYSGSAKDAAEIGFRDDFIYDFINGGCTDWNVLRLQELDPNIAKNMYLEYSKINGHIY